MASYLSISGRLPIGSAYQAIWSKLSKIVYEIFWRRPKIQLLKRLSVALKFTSESSTPLFSSLARFLWKPKVPINDL